MIDLTKITPDEARKIEVALLQLHNDVEKFIKGFDDLANDEKLDEGTKKTMAANREWWKSAYALIYGEE
jgi:hypothetical protein